MFLFQSIERPVVAHFKGKKKIKREKLNCLLSRAVIEVCFGLFAASVDLVNWLHRKKNNNNGSL